MEINGQFILNALVLLGAPTLILFFLKDRKKVTIENDVAEGTKKHQIDLSSITAVEAHVAFIQRAFEAERLSKDRQVADLTARLIEAEAVTLRQREELVKVRAELERLRGQVEYLNSELKAAMKRLDMAMGAESDKWDRQSVAEGKRQQIFENARVDPDIHIDEEGL